LEVYSALLGFTSGNAAWYLHTGYYLCNQQGKPLQYVENVANYSTGEPALVSLPPGDYIIHAEATGDVGVEVPVVIEAGQTTAVHLDNSWGPPQEYPKSSFVSLPSGEPVGWSAGTK
jgi:hypothetical protein